MPANAKTLVAPDGQKRLLSLRLAVSEASTHWGSVLEGLQARGLRAPKLVHWVFDYYTKLDFSSAHKIHVLRIVSASSALSSFFCYSGLVISDGHKGLTKRMSRN